MSILLVGDSILNGMKPYIEAAFAGRFGSTDIMVEAYDGASTAYWRNENRLQDLIVRHRPGLVVLALGTNDVNDEENVERYTNLVSSVSATARSYGSRLIWIGPWNDDAGGRARWSIIRGAVGSDDSIDGLALARGLERAPAGLHFVAASYRQLAERTAAEVSGRTVPAQKDDGIGAGFLAMAAGALVALLVAVLAR